MEIGKNKGKARIARIGQVQQTTDARQKESDVHRLETLEWLAEFVMACPEGEIPVNRQQRVIRELLNVTEMEGADFRRFFASAQRGNVNLKSRVCNELDAEDSRNGAFENH